MSRQCSEKESEFNRDTEEMGNVVQFAAQSVNLEVFFFTLHRSISLTCTHRNVYPPRHVTVRQGFNILSYFYSTCLSTHKYCRDYTLFT